MSNEKKLKTMKGNAMTKDEFVAYAKEFGLFNAVDSIHLPYPFFSYKFLERLADEKTSNFLERLALEENAKYYIEFGGNYYPINDIADMLKINEFLGFLK